MSPRRRLGRRPRAGGRGSSGVHRRRALAAGLAALAGGLALPACVAPVEPWERDRLAVPEMQPEPHPLHADLLDHVRRSRESGAGGGLSSGGGCGCD